MKYIPRKPSGEEPASSDPGAGDQRRPPLLYVEDEQLNQDVARTRLSKKYDLLIAGTDREACRLVSEHATKISLILMDIELKGSILNGIDLTRLLRGKLDEGRRPSYAKDLPSIDAPILFVTAYGQRHSHAELLDAGGDAVLHKPIDFMQLQAAMTRMYLKRG
jgi:CheY-like chemotaxis protein